MNRFTLKSLIGLLLLSFSFLIKADRINVLFAYEDKHNFPYYMDKGDKINWVKPGLSVELLKLLELKLNLKINFIRQPWDRCKQDLQAGKVDGIFNASFKYERLVMGGYPQKDKEVDSSRRITTISYVIYTNKNSNLKWDNTKKKFHNINGKIGAPKGYSIVKDLIKWKVPVEISISTFYDFKKLTQNRLAGVAALELAGDFFIKKGTKDFRDIKKLHPPLITKNYYLMLSHQFINKHPILSETIWDNIRELRENNLKILEKKYFEN